MPLHQMEQLTQLWPWVQLNSPDFQGTECWNGSSWSEIAEQNVRRVRMGGAGCPDDAQVFGGQGSYGSNSPLTNGTSEYWNGITWNTGGLRWSEPLVLLVMEQM